MRERAQRSKKCAQPFERLLCARHWAKQVGGVFQKVVAGVFETRLVAARHRVSAYVAKRPMRFFKLQRVVHQLGLRAAGVGYDHLRPGQRGERGKRVQRRVPMVKPSTTRSAPATPAIPDTGRASSATPALSAACSVAASAIDGSDVCFREAALYRFCGGPPMRPRPTTATQGNNSGMYSLLMSCPSCKAWGFIVVLYHVWRPVSDFYGGVLYARARRGRI